MRVMIDTNVIISALMFPASVPAKALYRAVEFHEVILCDYIIDEVCRIVAQKRPDLLGVTQELLRAMPYKLASPAKQFRTAISDPKDQPILDAAISGNVDMIISGDKHFLGLDIATPRIMSSAEFLAQ